MAFSACHDLQLLVSAAVVAVLTCCCLDMPAEEIWLTRPAAWSSIPAIKHMMGHYSLPCHPRIACLPDGLLGGFAQQGPSCARSTLPTDCTASNMMKHAHQRGQLLCCMHAWQQCMDGHRSYLPCDCLLLQQSRRPLLKAGCGLAAITRGINMD